MHAGWYFGCSWVFLGGDLVGLGDRCCMVLRILVVLVSLVFVSVIGPSGQGRPTYRAVMGAMVRGCTPDEGSG